MYNMMLQPKTPLRCKCYSDIKSKVVGILDNPEVLSLIYPTFFKVLTWKLSSICKEIPNSYDQTIIYIFC